MTAVPDAGYKFVDWSDSSTANPRTDTNVTASATYTANFALNDVTIAATGNIPAGSYHNITIGTGASPSCALTATMTGNVSVTGTISVGNCSRLDTNGFVVSGTGAFFSNNDSYLVIRDANGITSGNTLSGAIQTTGGRTYDTNSTYIYSGTTDQAVGNGLPASVAHLTISNTGLTGNNRVTGNPGQNVVYRFSVSAGVYVSHSSYAYVDISPGATLSLTEDITVAVDWNNAGTLEANGHKVTFIGGNQLISGSTTFYDLDLGGGNRTVTFQAGTTQTVTNALTASGTAGNLLSLRSSSTGNAWTLDAPATNVSYVNVKDSNSTNATTAIHSVNAGNNNANWLFNYTINGSTTSGGTVTPAGDTTVAFGGSQAYTITPDAGYAIASLVIDGGTIAAAPTYTFSSVAADHTISATFAADNHTVIFDANGGSGSMSNQVTNLPAALTTNTFTRTGYTFTGWNTAADGSGTGYANGATYPFTADATLYAQWTVNNYTVTYDGNSQTSGTAPVVGSGDYNTTIVLPGAGDLVKTGFSFGGWNTLANGTGTNYAAGANYTIPATNSTLFAKWDATTFTLTATPGANGNFKFVSADANGVTPVNPGDSRTYRIVPDVGYQVADVLVDSVSVGKGQSYTFTNVQANHTISATFEAVTNRTLTAGTVNTYYDAVIDVPVSVSDTTGANITAFDFSLNYDETKLEPVLTGVGTNVTISNGTVGTWSGNVVKAASGIINVSRFSATTPATGAGVLIYIKMHVKAHATTTAALTLDGQYAFGSYGAFAPFNGGAVGANAAVAGAVNINPTATSTTVVTSGTPSTYGNSVTFTATVTTGGTPAVSGGAVTFYDGGTCSLPGTALGAAVNIDVNGVAAISTAALSATGSPHTILACYGGVADFSASSGTVSQVVNPKSVAASVTADNKVYDGNDTAVIATCTIPGAVGADDVACSAAGPNTFSDKNVGTGKTVTATNISLTGTTAGNYVLSATTATTPADITTLALTATVAANNKPYDGNTTATINSCSFTNAIALDDVSCVTTGYAASFDNKNVGTSKPVTATGLSKSGTDAGNYTFAGSGTGTADITAIALTATVDANSRAYNGNATATINSCSFAGVVGSEDVTCVTTGYSASFNNKNVGTAKPVTATGLTMAGADVGNYSFTGSGTGAADITAIALTATVDANSRAYNGNASATINSCSFTNAIALDDVSCVTTGYSASFDNKNVGTAKPVTATGLTKTGTDAGNYIFTGSGTGAADITALALTATVDANSRAYNGNAIATINSCTFTNAIALDDVSCVTTGYSATFDNKNVGTAKPVTATGLTKSGADAGNYTFTGTGTGTANITAIALTATVDANSRAYNGNATATINSCSFAGVVGSEDVTCVITGYAASFNNKNVGTAKPVTATGLGKTGTDAGNYTFTGSGTGAADITAVALIATVDANSRAYNGNATATINSCAFTNAIALDDVSCVITGYTALFDNKNIGTGKPVTANGLSKTGTDAGNYTFTGSGTGAADITAVALIATVDANSRAYNGNATATINSCSFAGVVGSEDVTCVTTGYSASFNNKNVGTAKPVTATGLTMAGTDTGNYSFTGSGTGAADITAIALTATVDANSRAYNGNATATINGCSFTNAIALDDLACVTTGYTASFDNKNVGTAKLVTATGLTKSGADAGNYTFTGSGTGTADITAVALTATVDANSRAYNGNATATINSCAFNNAIALDDVACVTTGYTALFNNKNVGTAKTVTATGLSKSGTDAGNYTFTGSGTGAADITAIALTATVDANSRAYNGNATATINSCSFAGVLGSDDVTCLTTGYAASFDNKNVGTAKPVTATGLTKSGADAGNYSFTGSGTGTADITAIALTASVDANNKPYDGNATATINSCSFTNAVALDDVVCVITGYSATFDNANIGTGKVVTATGLTKSGSDAGNYTFTGTGNGIASITAGTINGTVLYYGVIGNPVSGVNVAGAGSLLVSGTTNGSGGYTIPGFGTGAYTMTPSRTSQLCSTQNGVLIDDAALVSEYVVGLTSLSDTQKLAAKVSGTATTTISSFDAALIAQKSVGICDSPNIAGQWKFDPATRSHPTVTGTLTDDYTAYLMGDVDGNWSSSAVPNVANRESSSPNAVRASLPVGNAQPGTEVTVPFRIDNLNGKSLNSYQFSVAYDPAVIVPADESANVDGTLSGNLNAVYNTPTPGMLRVGVYGAFPTQGDGVYVNLKFRVIGSNGSSSPLTISGFRFNRGTDEVTTVSGRITVGVATAEATLQGRVLAMGGRGVTGARVTATSAAGVVKNGFTTRNGQFIISGLAIGETYTVTVQSRRFVFVPRSVSISDSVTNVDFVAEQ